MELNVWAPLAVSLITLVVLLVQLNRLDGLLREELSRSRTEQAQHLADLERGVTNQLFQIAKGQQEQLAGITQNNNLVIARLGESHDRKLDDLKTAVEQKLKEIQCDNSDKLERMRLTVDEKLHRTLEERLGQSFRLVSERLELVQKGLGEMQSLAVGVGDLKKVLSNVKTRGMMGEMQLASILGQILAEEQYERNVRTHPHSRDVVEFAIRLPGRDGDGKPVYLPVDAKFPLEPYYQLSAAYEKGQAAEVDQAGKALEAAIRKAARDIHDKYLYPPQTTDFGVMFLPIEGLYAEVVRRPQLLETLQREYQIVVAGPTTFAALLNSLQMGFRTLAIEKRSSEVWTILSAVKTEFGKFGDVLKNAQKKISDAGDEIERLVGARSKKIIRQLNQVSELEPGEAGAVLLLDCLEDEETAG